MSLRLRQSAGGVAVASSLATDIPSTTSRRTAPELPVYQTPIYPLNAAARTALAALLRPSGPCSTKWLEENLNLSAANLADSAGEINDRLTEATESTRKRKAKRQRDSVDNAEELDAKDDEELAKLRDRVEKMTQRMETSVRRAIDGHVGLTAVRDVMNLLQAQANAAAGATQTAQTQATVASSRPFDTPATQTQGTGVPALAVRLRADIESRIDAYDNLPARARYVDHNDFIAFKRIVHDAQYPGDDAPPLPHATSWFADDVAPAPGVTAAVNQGDDDSDDDIAIAGQRISTRCPLTLREFTEPLTSTLCPHSFEKAAILGLIREQRPPAVGRNRTAPPGWIPTVRCPVPGCQMDLSEADLHTDVVLIRKIRRIQRAKEVTVEDGERARQAEAEEITSEVEDDIDELEGGARSTMTRMKSEAVSQRSRRHRDEIEDD